MATRIQYHIYSLVALVSANLFSNHPLRHFSANILFKAHAILNVYYFVENIFITRNFLQYFLPSVTVPEARQRK